MFQMLNLLLLPSFWGKNHHEFAAALFPSHLANFEQHMFSDELNSFPSFLHVKYSVYIFWYWLPRLFPCYAIEALAKVGPLLVLHSCS
jgi:hypothetical protein